MAMRGDEFAFSNRHRKREMDVVERTDYEIWSMEIGDDRQWADHLRSIARRQGNDGRRIDAEAYDPAHLRRALGLPTS